MSTFVLLVLLVLVVVWLPAWGITTVLICSDLTFAAYIVARARQCRQPRAVTR